MLQKEINKMLSTKEGTWDKMIAFSQKDIATMLHIPLSTVAQYIREGRIKTYKIGRHYRVSRKALYYFLEEHECIPL